MISQELEQQLRKAFDRGIVPAHVLNAIRTGSYVLEGELTRLCTEIGAGYEEGTCEYHELYSYLVHFQKVM